MTAVDGDSPLSAPGEPKDTKSAIPVFLLKTRSQPDDAYRAMFAASRDGLHFDPTFVPVLEHRWEDRGVRQVAALLREGSIGQSPESLYGGLVFSSQRAVEVFAQLVVEAQDGPGPTPLQDVPIYSVGPATCRALRAIREEPPLRVFGEHTGNGDKLARFILEHYGSWYPGRVPRPPLLFLVGEQRRDVIPKTLMADDIPATQRVRVDEVVVYSTGVMASFAEGFGRGLVTTAACPARWVVVFSPTGCDSMLAGLGMLDEATGKAKAVVAGRTTFIATIGPTTQSYLKKTFALDADVCAEQPTPEALWAGIVSFIRAGAVEGHLTTEPPG